MKLNQQFKISNIKQLECFYKEHESEFLFDLEEERRSYNREKYEWVFKINDGYVLGDFQDDMVVVCNSQDNKTKAVSFKSRFAKSKANCSSKYTGVSWHNKKQKWFAQIYLNGKQRFIGSFNNEYDAHIAYKNALQTWA